LVLGVPEDHVSGARVRKGGGPAGPGMARRGLTGLVKLPPGGLDRGRPPGSMTLVGEVGAAWQGAGLRSFRQRGVPGCLGGGDGACSAGPRDLRGGRRVLGRVGHMVLGSSVRRRRESGQVPGRKGGAGVAEVFYSRHREVIRQAQPPAGAAGRSREVSNHGSAGCAGPGGNPGAVNLAAGSPSALAAARRDAPRRFTVVSGPLRTS